MKRVFSVIEEIILLTFGISLGAAAIYYFALPYNLVTGTLSGIAMVLNMFLGGTPDTLSYWLMGMNAFLLALAFFLLGGEFGLKTVYTSLMLGPCMQVMDRILPYTRFTHEMINGELVQVRYSVLSSGMGAGEIWFDIVCFCLLLGASQAFLFRRGSSTGGLDIVAKILFKYAHLDIGTGVTLAGFVATCSGFFINDFRMVVIGLVTTWINGVAVDYFTASLNKRKRVCIITKDYDKVRQYIIRDLVRGCSLYHVTGGYSGEEYIEIQSLLTQEEFGRLRSYMEDNHITAFSTAGNCSEVYGLWLKHRKRHGHVEIVD